MRLCSGGVERTRTGSTPVSLKITSLISSSRFGVWGLNDTQWNCMTDLKLTYPYAAAGLKMLTRGCRGPYFSMALLNGVGVRGVEQNSDLWLGVTNLRTKREPQSIITCLILHNWISEWACNKKINDDFLHGVFLLSEGRLVPLQRCRNNGLLTAHWCWCERWILQVVTVLLCPHVEELKEHVWVSQISTTGKQSRRNQLRTWEGENGKILTGVLFGVIEL